ncbi:MAG: hypothetical protein CMB20_004670 [Methanobacteriota archaeon]|nr:MAG: hypothetical protein CMB20_004670 [Euryarchaeota archaeon]|tara:strand:- start:14048 stop:14854 length:807 start_codon:yes stop_codon:yes gene_type:complete
MVATPFDQVFFSFILLIVGKHFYEKSKYGKKSYDEILDEIDEGRLVGVINNLPPTHAGIDPSDIEDFLDNVTSVGSDWDSDNSEEIQSKKPIILPEGIDKQGLLLELGKSIAKSILASLDLFTNNEQFETYLKVSIIDYYKGDVTDIKEIKFLPGTQSAAVAKFIDDYPENINTNVVVDDYSKILDTIDGKGVLWRQSLRLEKDENTKIENITLMPLGTSASFFSGYDCNIYFILFIIILVEDYNLSTRQNDKPTDEVAKEIMKRIFI